jgi:hypothetical protein
MEKTGEVKVGTTRCDFCNKTSSVIDEDGIARCEDHPNEDQQRVKMASADLSKDYEGDR